MEIHVDILTAVAEGRQKPTHIMYRANLTWARLNNHLQVLLGQKLLAEIEDNGSSTYSLTDAGKGVVEYYRKIRLETGLRRKVVTSEASVLAR